MAMEHSARVIVLVVLPIWLAMPVWGSTQPRMGTPMYDGGQLPRTVIDHRLLPLHRAWLRSCTRRATSETGGGRRLLAALSVRFDPRRRDAGLNPLQLDSKPPAGDMASYLRTEGRFQSLERQNPDRFRALVAAAQRDALTRYALYQHLAAFAVATKFAPPAN